MNKTKIVVEWEHKRSMTSMTNYVVGKKLPKQVKKMLLNDLLSELKIPMRVR